MTALIGAWILFYHFINQGPVVTLVTTRAEELVVGKTKINSRSVYVGMVENVSLSEDLSKMRGCKRVSTAAWKSCCTRITAFLVVKLQIVREGVSGMVTLLSGAYIELQSGNTGKVGPG